MTKQDAKRFINDLKDNGYGGTFITYQQPFTSSIGYQVSKMDLIKIYPIELTPNLVVDLFKFIKLQDLHWELLRDTTPFIGFWLDSDTGLLNIDLSVFCCTEEWRDRLMSKTHQKAYWDWATMSEVRVNAQ